MIRRNTVLNLQYAINMEHKYATLLCVLVARARFIYLFFFKNFIHFVFLLSNRCILSLTTEKHRNFPKSTHIRASALSDYSYPISATKQPTRALPFTNPRSHPRRSPLPPFTLPKSASKRRDASARASFHCGRRTFPATFVRPRQGRYWEAKLFAFVVQNYSFYFPLNDPRFCLNYATITNHPKPRLKLSILKT